MFQNGPSKIDPRDPLPANGRRGARPPLCRDEQAAAARAAALGRARVTAHGARRALTSASLGGPPCRPLVTRRSTIPPSGGLRNARFRLRVWISEGQFTTVLDHV